ncbi:MAG TPA: CHAT domain-containing protein, partial [Pyrinomonadaceae bacterium]|nr:CHAT domain-containing protein [Pyrinomonadaceae bacterium]
MSTTRMILAEYFMTNEAVLLFIVRDDFGEPEVLTIDRKPAEIEEFVTRNFQADTDSEGRVLKSTGEKVRRLDEDAFHDFFAPFVAPLVARSDEGDLIWLVPYDVLHYLPLHAVRVNDRYLIERNPVTYTPSASIMKYCQLQGRRGRDSALVVGDSLNDLPSAREEALTVSKIFGTNPLLGSAATKNAVTELIKQAQQSLDVLHFSCHGYFDNLEALKSGIMLAPGTDLQADGR